VIKLEGMNELIRALHDAPEQIRDEAMVIVRDETEGAAVEMAQSYPSKTGRLRASVKTSYPSSTLLIGIAQATAPHSHLFEFGTRRRATSGGANRGVMPAEKSTPAIAQRRRERMTRRLIELLERRGFQVTE
jgi:hypothetical protein